MDSSRRLVQVLVLLYGLLLVPSSTLGLALPIPTGVSNAQAARIVPGITSIDDNVFHTTASSSAIFRPFSIEGQVDGGGGGDQQLPADPTPLPAPTPTPTPTPETSQNVPQAPITTPSSSSANQVNVQASDIPTDSGLTIPTASVVTITMTPGVPLPSSSSSSAESVPTDSSTSSVQEPTEVSPPAAGLSTAMIALIAVVISLAVIVSAGVVYVKYWRNRRRESERAFYDPEAGGPSTSATASQLSMQQSTASTLPSVMARTTPLAASYPDDRRSYPLPTDPFSVPTAYNRADVLIMPPMPSSNSTRSQTPSHSANSSLSYPSHPSHSASSSLSHQPPTPILTGSSSSGTLQAPLASPRNPFSDGPPSPNPEIRIQPPSLPSSEGSVFSDYDELGSDMFFVPPPINQPTQHPGYSY